MPRDATLDNARAAGIVAVVLGHTMGLPDTASTVIYAVHMPLFFVLAGCLLQPDAWQASWGKHLRRQSTHLLLPFLLFFALGYGYWLATRNLGSRADKFAGVAWFEPLAGLSGRYQDLAIVNGPLWFFCALFLASVGLATLCHWLGKRLAFGVTLMATLALLLTLDAGLMSPGAWYSADVAVLAAGFMVGGYLIAGRLKRASPTRKFAAGLGLVLLALFVALALQRGRVDLAVMQLGGSSWRFVIVAWLGVAAVLLLARALPGSRAAVWLSHHSLVIFPTHVLVLNLFSGLAQMALGWSAAAVRTPLFAVLSAVVAIAAAIPIAWVLQRLWPSVFKPMPAVAGWPRAPTTAASGTALRA